MTQPNPITLERPDTRSHERFPCGAEVTWLLPRLARRGRARLRDLGLGGACLELPCAIEGPETIELCLAEGTANELRILGRVVWSSWTDAASTGRTGIQFTRMDDATRRALYALLRSV